MVCPKCGKQNWSYLGVAVRPYHGEEIAITGFRCVNCGKFSVKLEPPRNLFNKPPAEAKVES